MIAIIAEKPGVAREIAAIVGANDKKDGFLSGNGYMVTWAFGHLIQLAMPGHYGIQGFRKESLPVIPAEFKLVPRQSKGKDGYKNDPGAMKQLKVIESVFNTCDRIINCCDAGREGEAIFRYIYRYLGCAKPFDRLWISSLTDKAIREGLNNLKDGRSYDKLYEAAKARGEADWLVGINASQALSLSAGQGVFSLGRVQTPTLAMVCSRYLEHKGFVPVPYLQLRIQAEKGGIPFEALSVDKYEDKQAGSGLTEKLKQEKTLHVTSVECRESIQEPPLLYDLTALQKEANSRLGFSADKTLQAAQKLYESKLITYPRTGSRYLPEDMYGTVPVLIANLREHPLFGSYAESLTILNKRCIDDKKITDHHALLITENMPSGLAGAEKAVYGMIAGRMLESFSPKCIKDVTSVEISCGGMQFQAKGSVTRQAGWRAVFNQKDEEDTPALPPLAEGERLPLSGAGLLEKQTKAKPLHTESSLLAAMENAGKALGNEEYRAAMKDCGIGTPATRAAIIETLFSRGYILRDKKSLVPTEKGLSVYNTVKDKRIADAEMTGLWEHTFAKIESGEADAANFRKGIEVYTAQVTDELLDAQTGIQGKESCLCPKCKKSKLDFHALLARCPDSDCGFVFFRKRNGRELTDKQLVSLLTTGKTEVIRGFKSKSGKSFDASLVMDDGLKVLYKFPENGKKSR